MPHMLSTGRTLRSSRTGVLILQALAEQNRPMTDRDMIKMLEEQKLAVNFTAFGRALEELQCDSLIVIPDRQTETGSSAACRKPTRRKGCPIR